MLHAAWSVACAGLALLGISASASARTLSFPTKVLEQHLIGSISPVQASVADEFYFAGGRVEITINIDGSVTDARVHDVRDRVVSFPPLRDRALSLRFRPFEYDGKPVEAVGIIEIPVTPPKVWKNPDAHFPPADLNNLQISLTRSACFGSCPDYRVTISGNGETRFVSAPAVPPPANELFRKRSLGPRLVAPGTHADHVDAAALRKLVDAFRAAHFFGLKNEYRAMVTDNPTYVLTFRTGDKVMEVTDYVGRDVGMPRAVTELEDAVDDAADTQRWTVGNSRTVPALIAEGMKVDSTEAIRLAGNAVRADGGEAVLLGLIGAGLPLDRLVTAPDGKSAAIGKLLTIHAIESGRPKLARELIGRGWLKAISREELNEAFASGGGGCAPSLAQQLVSAGANPNAHAPSSGSGGYHEGGETALISALDHYGTCRDLDESERLALADSLLKFGVNLNGTDANGRSALFFRDNPEEQALLLRAGADVNLRDRDAETPVFDARTDSEALPLLDAGANPNGTNKSRATLRDLANDRNMLATVDWLDQHRIP